MKKQYICPSVCVIEIDAMTLLAGSDTQHDIAGGLPGVQENDSNAETGGSCAKDDLHNIWGDDEW